MSHFGGARAPMGMRLALLPAVLAACSGTGGELFDSDAAPPRPPDMVTLGPVAAEHEWSLGVGTTGDEHLGGSDVDDDGGIYLAGTYDAAAGALDGLGLPWTPGLLHTRAFVLASRGGAPHAILTWGGAGDVTATDVAVGPDGTLLVCGATEDEGGRAAYVFSHLGHAPALSVAFPASDGARGTGVALTNERRYVTIDFEGSITIGQLTLVSAGGTDGVLVALDLDGRILWGRHLAGPGDDHLAAVDARNDGLVLVGSTSKGANLTEVGQVPAGALIARFARDGAPLWSDVEPGATAAGDVRFHADGAATWVGATAVGGFLAQHAPDGLRAWLAPSPLAGNPSRSLTVDAAGHIFVGGDTTGLVDGIPFPGAALAVHDADGTLRTIRVYPTSGTIRALAKSDVGLFAAGDLRDLDFGGDPLGSTGGTDLFFTILHVPH